MRTIKSIVAVLSTPWLAKVVLALVFLTQLGVVPFLITEWAGSPSQRGLTFAERQNQFELWHEVGKMTEVMLAEAQAKGPDYSPDDYFYDLIKIQEKKKELGIVIDGMMFDVHSRTTDFQQVHREHKAFKNYSEYEWEQGRRKYREYVDPGRVPREELKRDIDEIGWPRVMKIVSLWLASLYGKCLPVAFALFLLWIKDSARDVRLEAEEFEQRTRVFLRNPLTFALLLAAYPLVIAYVWTRRSALKGQEWLIETELRKTKSNLFRRLSKDESELVSEFVRKKLSRRQVRGALSRLGRQQRHRFATAFAATILVAIVTALVGSPLSAGVQSLADCDGLTDLSTHSADGVRDGPVLEDDSDEEPFMLWPGSLVALVPDLFQVQSPAQVGVVDTSAPRTRDRSGRKPEHVPINWSLILEANNF